MLKVIPKCKKCNKSMRDSIILSDKDDNTFTQFIISYCPYCIELDDKVEARVWAKTIKKCQQENKDNRKATVKNDNLTIDKESYEKGEAEDYR